MSLLLLIIILVLLFGGGFGWHNWGPIGGGISIGTILIIILIIWLLGGLR